MQRGDAAAKAILTNGVDQEDPVEEEGDELDPEQAEDMATDSGGQGEKRSEWDLVRKQVAAGKRLKVPPGYGGSLAGWLRTDGD